MTLYDRIESTLREKRLQKQHLAEYLDVARSTLCTWLSKKDNMPGQYIVPICEFLDVAPHWLLTGEEAARAGIPADFMQVTDDERLLIETVRKLSREGAIVVTAAAIQELRTAQNAAETACE